MIVTRLFPDNLSFLQPFKTCIHPSWSILIHCHQGALSNQSKAGHPHSQTHLHTITREKKKKKSRNTHTGTQRETQRHTHTLTSGHNSVALWSREGSVTPQRLGDSPSITQSHPHLISPVNERLSVSRAVIGRWAPSVTVSGKCRSMGSVENGVLQI